MAKFHHKSFLAILALYYSLDLPCSSGLAYAPNFVTRLISESTGKKPVGLLDIPTKGNNDSEDDVASSDKATEISTKSSVLLDSPIVTRFPPEPNGYLHLGHAKAVSFNFAVARMFPPNGRCHMRLDDTNPSKENQEYIDSILEDVRWIQSGEESFMGSPIDNEHPENNGPWFGRVHKTSDNFQLMFECARALVKNGDAYVDSLSAEEMKEYRGTLTEPGKDSPYRDRSVEENLGLLDKMRAGECKEGEHVVRAKIDMSSSNINMRDPTLFRIKHESHPSTGDEWCIYPMYDFSHPIQDAVEGITHSLCTLEFEDHRPFYDWTLEKLIPTGLIHSRPRQIEFSRLNLKYTVLSKRKLIQLVEEKHVNGWDDPRMPTLSGIRRRGAPPQALRLFCERVGISKADSVIDVGELENCIREVMDDTSKRAFAILNPLKVTITNWEGSSLEDFQVPCHPKKEEMGERVIPFGQNLYIERSDFFDTHGPEGEANGGKVPKGFKRLLYNDKVRLRYAYVIHCDEVVRDSATNEPVELKCTMFPETRAGVTPEGMQRVKGIIQWVEGTTAIKCTINQYDRLFLTEEPGKATGSFLDDVNPNSLQVLDGCLVEPSVLNDCLELMAKIGSTEEKDWNNKMYHSELAYQFERTGYFALDPDSTTSKPVFNRVVTLRDTWVVTQTEKKVGENVQNNRNRGRGENIQKDSSSSSVLEDIRRVAIRAATILEAEQHPDAENLVVCRVDCGDEDSDPRVVVASLGGKIMLEDLVNKKVACVTNLKPAKMRGIESTAMLLAASNGAEGTENIIELLEIPDSVPNGELLYFDSKERPEPDTMMKSKGALKAFDRVKSCLKVNSGGHAIFCDDGIEHAMLSSAGPVLVPSLTNVVIQ